MNEGDDNSLNNQHDHVHAKKVYKWTIYIEYKRCLVISFNYNMLHKPVA